LRRSFIILLCSVLLASGCWERIIYKCRGPDNCVIADKNDPMREIEGVCLRATDGLKYCAFPDPGCSTMLRWGELAADPYFNQCVDPSVPLDAAVDAPADMATNTAADSQ
jgi:hypothetical protein